MKSFYCQSHALLPYNIRKGQIRGNRSAHSLSLKPQYMLLSADSLRWLLPKDYQQNIDLRNLSTCNHNLYSVFLFLLWQR